VNTTSIPLRETSKYFLKVKGDLPVWKPLKESNTYLTCFLSKEEMRKATEDLAHYVENTGEIVIQQQASRFATGRLLFRRQS
jgi:hypothetical protein